MKTSLNILLATTSLMATSHEPDKIHCHKVYESNGLIELHSAKELETLLDQKGQKTYVDVYSTYCPPCRTLAPEFEKWAKDNSDQARFVKVNSNEVREIPEKYSIRGVPTLLVFDENGNLVDRKVGIYEIRDFMSNNP